MFIADDLLTPRHEMLDTGVHWPVAESGEAMMRFTPPIQKNEILPPDFRISAASMAIVST
jgi:hypothetical protein